jgi:hypothetical protein
VGVVDGIWLKKTHSKIYEDILYYNVPVNARRKAKLEK